ncbi:hypothetical protein IP88_16080 [alpha proteobacterium AAP81b]|nr:hypothetical protein IP88_16080 [alpha proteobacterium AAP81b]
MPLHRRHFLAGSAASLAAGAAGARISAAGASAGQQRALAAIADYLEVHRRHFGLPGLGLIIVDGAFTAIVTSGTRDYRETVPLADSDLWQIGSISKSFIALICLQLAGEGKMTLDADIRSVLPEAALPGGAPFTIRGLLDHTTGLPDFAPEFGMDGGTLWRGFEPGAHWYYSNTGYDLLGAAIARIEGRPVGEVIEARIARPLGMAATRGAIRWRDRARYPASYAPLRPDLPTLQRMALAPAPWVDAALAAGSVASTLPDIARYLRYLINAGQGRGAPLLSDAAAAAWLANPVLQDPAVKDELYGLGLMHRFDEGRRLLHHTGGMVSFSSSFHVDAAAGTGAFASCAVGGINYRPRLLTRFAVKALRLARAGAAIPAPPSLGPDAVKPADYAGRYVARDGSGFTITPGLALAAAGTSAAIEAPSPDALLTAHPGFDAFPLLAVRAGKQGPVVALDHGSRRYARDGATAPALPPTPPGLAALAGRYQSDDPWIGGVTLVARGDTLYAGGTDALADMGNGLWRPAEPQWSPERLRFTGFVDGRPQLLVFSGRPLERRD